MPAPESREQAFYMKPTPPSKASTKGAVKPHELAARLAAAKSKAETARKAAEEAKAVFKRARKTHKHAKKAAKAAKREVKALKKLLAAAKIAAARAKTAKARKSVSTRKPVTLAATVAAPVVEIPAVPLVTASAPSETPQRQTILNAPLPD